MNFHSPAGLMASTALTSYGLSVLHIDNRPEPTTAGRADGIQPRTIEVSLSKLLTELWSDRESKDTATSPLLVYLTSQHLGDEGID